ncbi:hypothetical protein GGI22_001176 [Coemansia erecta]|nr:hypothetical protein GGI22_001176 [Coemansia erecta]
MDSLFRDSSQLTLVGDDNDATTNAKLHPPLVLYSGLQGTSSFELPAAGPFAQQPIGQHPFFSQLPQMPMSPIPAASQQPLFPWQSPISMQPLIQPDVLGTPTTSGVHTPKDQSVPLYGLPGSGGCEWSQISSHQLQPVQSQQQLQPPTHAQQQFQPIYSQYQLEPLQSQQCFEPFRIQQEVVHQIQTQPIHSQQQQLQQLQQQQEDLLFHAPLPLLTTPTGHRTQTTASARNKTCSNCGVFEAPTWRRHPKTGASLCNACGLYVNLHSKEREWTVNARGQRVVKRQPRGSMARRRNQTRAARAARGRAVDQNPLDLVRQEFAQVTAALPLDRSPNDLMQGQQQQQQQAEQNQQQAEQNQQQAEQHQQQTNDPPLAFSHFYPLNFK